MGDPADLLPVAGLLLHGLDKTYPGSASGEEVRAVREVHLEVRPGECVTVCGPSGCGKTTLLLMAGGLLRPTAGTVSLNGEDPYALSAEDRAAWRARAVGFVFQQAHLVPYLSVLENVLAPSLAVATADPEGRARELLGRFGLEARASHLPGALSSGEQQRAGLARALFHDPPLLLADEPTGNLDDANGETVLQALRGRAEAGRMVLLVSHDPAARTVASRVVRMREGRVSRWTGED